MASHLRLRLVVRRNGLPEASVAWPVPLEHKPTIANLLEQVNEILPLESADWGLEDYTVELKGSDGSNFECLHFQPVQSVLKEDDQVFIRPLFTDDLRRRRVSGRHQVSSDGKHLIDGIAFGRPLLKTPRGRPALDIPPRKRRRIGFHHEEEFDRDDEEDSEYEEPQEQDEPMLLLTNGEEQHGDRRRSKSVRIAADLNSSGIQEGHTRRKSVRIATSFGNSEPIMENEDENVNTELENQPTDGDNSDTEEDDDMQYEFDHDEVEDLARELEDLQDGNENEGLGDELDREAPQKSHTGNAERSPIQQRHQALGRDNGSADGQIREEQLSNGLPLPKNLEGLDKIGMLLSAFPAAPIQVCREILTAEEGDMRKSYLTLLQAFEPKLPESELLKRWQSRSSQLSGVENTSSMAPAGANSSGAEVVGDIDEDDEEGEEDQSEDEENDDDVTPFIRRFDRKGLPPGTISNGFSKNNALKAMADISNALTGNTLQTFIGSKRNFDEPQEADVADNNDDDDETSSSGSSSSSEEDGEVNNDQSSDSSSSDSDAENSHANEDSRAGLDLGNSDTSSSGSSSDSDSDSDSDSGPEERSTKAGASFKFNNPATALANASSSVASSSSSEDSDADDETSSDESSEDDSSDSESNSDSEGEEDEIPIKKPQARGTTVPASSSAIVDQAQPAMVSTQLTGIPGSGKPATKNRNARRRAAKKFKSEAAQSQSSGGDPSSQRGALAAEPGTQATERSKAEQEKELFEAKRQALLDALANGDSPVPEPPAQAIEQRKVEQEKLVFEAKRQALLDALANGGVEVGPGSELGLEDLRAKNKRKRNEPGNSNNDKTVEQSAEDTLTEIVPVTEEDSPTSAQKRRRLDLGVGRRMLFGALGLRNPKTKDDEDKLRNKLMQDIRPLQNIRLADEASAKVTEDENQGGNTFECVDVGEQPDAWRAKIIYRAVECCQEGIDLSEPPFPFVQRWDPQQQNSWHKNNKRGGRGKRADRNQSHFYQDGGNKENERSYDEPQDWEESFYDNTFEEALKPGNAGVVLNYDDVEQGNVSNDVNDTTRLTDVDDLPSLPENLDDLKPLHPGEAQNGMVITWKQFILSKATNWQPQVLSLSGVICRIDDDASGLEVMLAKRDRHLEEPEKEYDNNTGQRIYDKFEAPDVDDEEEEEDEETKRMQEGYRSLSFSTMMDPRVLQPAIPLDEAAGESALPSIEAGPKDSRTDADASAMQKDITFEGFDDSIYPSHNSEAMAGLQETTEPVGSIQVSEPLVKGIAEPPQDDHSGEDQPPADIPESDLLQVSSPSRQLHDETSSVIVDELTGDELPMRLSLDTTPLIRETSLGKIASDPSQDHEEFSMQIHENDVITGTPRPTYSKFNIPQSSASSIYSGRQLDFTMDMDVDQPESFIATTEDSNEHDGLDKSEVSIVPAENTTVLSENREDTPIPSSAQESKDFNTPTKLNTVIKANPDEKKAVESNQSTPCSLASLGTVWCTAATSRQTQSPSKTQLLSAIKSQKSQASDTNDAEYEEAMRKLDAFSDEDDASQSSKISDSVKSKSQLPKVATQSSSLGGGSDSERASSLPPGARTDVDISPPPISRHNTTGSQISQVRNSPPIKKPKPVTTPFVKTRKSSRTSQSKFVIPPDSQVFEISSDDDEPKFVEHYADDDNDDDYQPASIPEASDWVKKSRPARSSTAPVVSQTKTSKAGKVMGASQTSGTFRSQLKGMESAAAAMKRINKGRKKGAKF